MFSFKRWVVSWGFLFLALLLEGSVGLVYAQVTTTLTPDSTLPSASAVTQLDSLFNITQGTQVGQNLLHSFETFHVGSGDTANFVGQIGVTNILSRVTGSDQSNIFGTLQSSSTANLFFLNPRGIVFGPSAQLDVQGSFFVSTADSIKFQDGGAFFADPVLDAQSDSILQLPPPESFGFLTYEFTQSIPAPITIDQSVLLAPVLEEVALVGGDISIIGDSAILSPATPNVAVPAGALYVASTASPGVVALNRGEHTLQLENFGQLGNIEFSQGGHIDVAGLAGGTVVIRGGRLTMTNNSLIFATTQGAFNGLPTAVDVEVTDDVVINTGARILADVSSDAAGHGGDIQVQASQVDLNTEGRIRSITFFGDTGDGGEIQIEANNLQVRNGGFIQSRTLGSGDGSNITLNVDDLEIRDGGLVFADAAIGSGNGGKVTVNSQNVVLSATNSSGSLTGINNSSFRATGQPDGTGKVGDIQITTHRLEIEDAAEISTPTFTGAQGGDIQITAEGDVIINGMDGAFTGIFTNTFGTGMGGHLSLAANNLTMNDRASLQAGTIGQSGGPSGGATISVNQNLELLDASFISTNAFFGVGDAADLTISAGNVVLDGLEDSVNYFSTDFTGLTVGTITGKGGSLFLAADNVQIQDNAQIDASSAGVGIPGEIELILRGDLSLLNGGNILSLARGNANGGDIIVKAKDVTLSGVNIIDPTNLNPNGEPILQTSTIAVQAQTLEPNAGNIYIQADNISVLEGAKIESRTLGAGNAGNIEIVAESLIISGESVEKGNILGNPFAGHSTVAASTESLRLGEQANGKAGDIQITAQQVEVAEKGELNSGTTSKGDGGQVNISTNRLVVRGDGRIRTVAEPSSHPNVLNDVGDAGSISISAIELFQADNGIVSVAADGKDSNGGFLTINSKQLELRNDAVLSTRNLGGGNSGALSITIDDTFSSNNSRVLATAEQGTGGDLTIFAGRNISVINDSLVSTQTVGLENAGDITLEAGASVFLDHSTIKTIAEQADGGNIKLQAPEIIQLVDSQITSSVGGGPTTVGGNISLDPEFIILQNSQILANAFGGQGGSITLDADVAILIDPFSLIDASSALGINGSVNIQAPIQNLSGTIAPLKHTPTNISTLYGSRCVANTDGQYSTFVERPVAGSLPAMPGGFLTSPLLHSHASDSSSKSQTDSRALPRNTSDQTESILRILAQETLPTYLTHWTDCAS